MKSKAIIGILIAIFAGAGVAGLGLWYFHYRTPAAQETAMDSCMSCPTTKSGGNQSVAKENRIVLYYFRTSQSSDSVDKAERLATETVKTQFAAALTSGKLDFQVINTDVTDMKMFMHDYSVPAHALFLMEYKNNQPSRWRLCDKIWLLVSSDDSFRNYVIKEVSTYLGKS
jgi:hypothetical protein